MKSLVLQVILVAFQLLFIGDLVRAEEAHPCQAVVSACVAAGYPIGGAKEGKGAYRHCMHELLQGKKTIADLKLTVAQSAVDACKAKPHPCLNLESACESAGFLPGGAKDHKGLISDCMRPLMAGQTVASVTVDANDIQACKAMKEKHMEKRGRMGKGSPAKQ